MLLHYVVEIVVYLFLFFLVLFYLVDVEWVYIIVLLVLIGFKCFFFFVLFYHGAVKCVMPRHNSKERNLLVKSICFCELFFVY